MFEANRGQTDSQVKFLARGSGYSLFLTPAETVLVLRKRDRDREVEITKMAHKLGKSDSAFPESTSQSAPLQSVVRMKIVRANAEAEIVGLEELPGKANYFEGNDSKKWRTNIPTYAKVQYRNIYPGVDLVYYGNQRHLEYDFVVSPGSDPSVIRLAFEGTEKIELNSQGDLILRTPVGNLKMHKPLVYQEMAGVKKIISAAYVLKPHSAELGSPFGPDEPTIKSIGMQIASYDLTRPLIIDPVLVYSTYLGGSGQDEGRAIAVDSAGNAYATGFAVSADFPTTEQAFDRTVDGNGFQDAFVAKLSVDGSSLVYSTYLGGSLFDAGLGIAVDSNSNAHVTGFTQSADFPITTGAFRTTFAGGTQDAFVTTKCDRLIPALFNIPRWQ